MRARWASSARKKGLGNKVSTSQPELVLSNDTNRFPVSTAGFPSMSSVAVKNGDCQLHMCILLEIISSVWKRRIR
jgi:hypothetical protein